MVGSETFAEVFWTLATFGFVVAVLGVVLFSLVKVFKN